jgi:hypothetical protein
VPVEQELAKSGTVMMRNAVNWRIWFGVIYIKAWVLFCFEAFETGVSCYWHIVKTKEYEFDLIT